MPTYEFQCGRCGRMFEARMTMAAYSAGADTRCPACGDPKPRRLLTSTVHVLTSRASSESGGECAGPCATGEDAGGGCQRGACSCG